MKARNCISIILIFLIVYGTTGQITDYEIINFSVEDGIPSNECHDIVQDSLGYVWIATDRGLSRFDGYGFKNYGKKEGLGDLSCLKLYLDRHNNIWISTLGKKIYKYISLRDTIVTYEYNHLLQPYFNQATFNFASYLDEYGNSYFGLFSMGIVKITPEGLVSVIALNSKATESYYSYEIESFFMLGIGLPNYNAKKIKLALGQERHVSSLKHKDLILTLKDDINQNIFGNPRAFKYSDTNYVYTINGFHYFFTNQELQKVRKGNEILDIIVLDNKIILTAQIFKQGVKAYKDKSDFMKDKSITFLENISASGLLEDKQKNIFISTLEDGFYYLKRKSIKPIHLVEDSNTEISKFDKKDDEILFILLNKNRVIEKNIHNKNLKPRYESPNEILDILYNHKSSELYLTGQTSYRLLDITGQMIPHGFCGERFKNSMAYNRYIPLKDKILALGHLMFGIFSDLDNTAVFCSEGIIPYKRFLSGSDFKNGSYLLGALDGLFILNGNNMVKSDSIHPIFQSRINDIKIFKNKYLLATLGNGLGVWDGEKNISVIQKSDGILTDNIERIYVGDDSKVYLCTKSGLSEITFAEDYTFKIKNYTRHHGLSSNIVNDVIQMGDSLYIGTAKGLCILTKETQIEEVAKMPIIESVEVNDKTYKRHELPAVMPYKENNITIQFKSLDLSLSGDILYKIRLNQDNWIETKATSVNYFSLKPRSECCQLGSGWKW